MMKGPRHGATQNRQPPTLYERAPVRFWQGVAALLALALLAAITWLSSIFSGPNLH